MKFIQRTLPVGPLACNCQILVCPKTHETILVDPGDEPETIIKNLKAIENEIGAKLKVKALFHTHAHFDHIGGTRKVKEYFEAQVPGAAQIYLHKDDEFIYKNLKAKCNYSSRKNLRKTIFTMTLILIRLMTLVIQN